MEDSRSLMLTSAFVPIPGGWFTMGTERGQEDERPPHRVFVDGFELGVFPVTRAEYECFVDATGHEPPRDWSHPPFAQPDLPVVGVSWLDAVGVLRVAIRAKTGARSGCRPKPSGNSPRAGGRRRSSRGATSCRSGFRTADAVRYRHRGR